jgi:hypothetical protein
MDLFGIFLLVMAYVVICSVTIPASHEFIKEATWKPVVVGLFWPVFIPLFLILLILKLIVLVFYYLFYYIVNGIKWIFEF